MGLNRGCGRDQHLQSTGFFFTSDGKGHFDVAQGLLKTIHKLNELKKHYWLHV